MVSKVRLVGKSELAKCIKARHVHAQQRRQWCFSLSLSLCLSQNEPRLFMNKGGDTRRILACTSVQCTTMRLQCNSPILIHNSRSRREKRRVKGREGGPKRQLQWIRIPPSASPSTARAPMCAPNNGAECLAGLFRINLHFARTFTFRRYTASDFANRSRLGTSTRLAHRCNHWRKSQELRNYSRLNATKRV